MATNGEINYERNRVLNRNKESNHVIKHRFGKAAHQLSRMAAVSTIGGSGGSNRVVSSRQSNSSSHREDGGGHETAQKSRMGTAAAIKALCGKSGSGSEKHKQKSGSNKGGDGSIVKTPAAGAAATAAMGGQMRCETAPLTEKERNAPQSIAAGDEKCHDVPYRHIPEKCTRAKEKWQNGVYCRDECGSGIVAKKLQFKHSRQVWCTTPLSMYQATIGELGRQILCREKVVPRDVKPGPPCNICEYVLPPCRGYYRKYDCIRPCEEEYVSYKQGRKLYRDRVERYWEPCMSKDQMVSVDINTFAHQNAFLGSKLRRKFNESIPCW